MQALHAHSSVAVGMKGATKAMGAMNKVACWISRFKYILCAYIINLIFILFGFILKKIQRGKESFF